MELIFFFFKIKRGVFWKTIYLNFYIFFECSSIFDKPDLCNVIWSTVCDRHDVFSAAIEKIWMSFLCYDLLLRAMCPHPGDQVECTSVSLSAATGIWPNGCGGDPGSSTGPVCGWRKTPDTGAGNAPLFSPASSDPAGLWPPPGYSSMSHRPPSKGTVASEMAKKESGQSTHTEGPLWL